MTSHCFVVLTRPVSRDQEAEYNRWYDEEHVPDVLKVNGVVSAQRFCVEREGERQYLALYNFETDDPDACMAEIKTLAGTDRMRMSPTLDLASIDAVLYTAHAAAVFADPNKLVATA